MPRHLSLLCLLLLPIAGSRAAEPDAFEERVMILLEGLGAEEPLERLAAEGELSDLAKQSSDQATRLMGLLPEVNKSMPPAVRVSLERIRIRAQRGIARRATGASRITLDVVQQPLSEVLAELELQTGNRFVDNREQFGGEAIDRPITLKINDEPFWTAIDRLLDEADLSLYAYGEEGALTLVDREPNAGKRVGTGAYGGPFRFEPLSLAATRGLRDESQSRIDLQVEVAWEPRLRPIAISQPLSGITILGSHGEPLAVRTPDQSIDLEATPGEQALEMIISLALPPRSVKSIEKISGQMMVIIPATQREFQVKKVGAAKLPIVQEFGDATVRLERFTKQNEIWELHMRLSLAGAGDALASHRGWVFQNKTYLLKPDGTRIEHAGFETTMQTESEIGIAYLFDLSGGAIYDFDFSEDAAVEDDKKDKPIDPKELTWVYETPTGVYTVPVSWELGPIKLP